MKHIGWSAICAVFRRDLDRRDRSEQSRQYGLTDLTRIPYNANALRIAIAQAQCGQEGAISNVMARILDPVYLHPEASEERAQLIELYGGLGKLATKNLVEDAYTHPLSERQAASDLRISENRQAVCL